MKKWAYFIFIALMAFIAIRMSIGTEPQSKKMADQLDIQGHRGARGLLPENSLPAFKKALELGVSTLELDLAVTKDRQLVVSHEPWISSEICLNTEGGEIGEEESRKLNIYQMSFEEVSLYDCGSKQHPRFPDQQKMSVAKPLLADMIKQVESYAKEIGASSFGYNIEIKSLPMGDDIYHPTPSVFSDAVFGTVDSLLSWDRVTIQSFDFRVLQYFSKRYPEVRLAALVENDEGWAENIRKLGFTPDIYSCYYKQLKADTVKDLQTAGIKVIPWTVNTAEEMQELIGWGVDGIITDYPNIAVNLTPK